MGAPILIFRIQGTPVRDKGTAARFDSLPPLTLRFAKSNIQPSNNMAMRPLTRRKTVSGTLAGEKRRPSSGRVQ